MKLFLDTANIEQITQACAWGVIAGATTNPTLLSKEGKDPEDVLREICRIVDGPVSAEVVSTKAEGMVSEAEKLSKLSKNIVIKIPVTDEGLKATKILSAKKIKTNVTLVFSANQALLAANAGASYVSPFIGRLDDQGQDGMQLIREIMGIYKNYGFKTEVIVASVRHPMHVTEAAKIGAHIATVPFDVLQKLFRHPLTDAGIKKFLEDWKKLTG